MLSYLILFFLIFFLILVIGYILIRRHFKINEKDVFYVSEIDNKLSFISKEIKLYPNIKDATVYNPSIIRVGNDLLMLSRVTIPIIKLNFYSPKPKLIFTDNSCITCKFKNLNLEEAVETSNVFKVSGIPGCDSQGMEDPRIFLFKNELYFSCVLVNSGCGTNVYIAKLNKSFNDIEYILEIKCTFDKVKVQKNWNFLFEKNNEMYFSYCLEPHIVARIDSKGYAYKAYESSNEDIRKKYPKKFSFRGGTRAVKINKNFFLGIAHVCDGNLLRIYRHVFYIIENKEPYRIVKISKDFCIPDNASDNSENFNQCSKIQFCSGLEYIKEYQELWISFGSRDKKPFISRIPLEKVFDMFENLY